MTQAAVGPAGGSDAAVLQDGAEMGGCVRLSRRKRPHGGEDQRQTVGYIFVWGASQSGGVA